MTEQTKDGIRQAVRDHYGKIVTSAVSGGGGCSPAKPCCGADSAPDAIGRMLGYTDEQLRCAPGGANLGLGCGNPEAIAELVPGETVLDLGSGAGFDCFIAARQVGAAGRVIGVDMTPEMIQRARENAARAGMRNVEFRLGEIEHLPAADNSVDVVISNCVLNLSPEKAAVFKEAFRVLKPGGRLAISDIVATQPLSATVRQNLALITGCVGGAAEVDELKRMLQSAGFDDVRIAIRPESRRFIREWFPEHGIADAVASAAITARKPGGPPNP